MPMRVAYLRGDETTPIDPYKTITIKGVCYLLRDYDGVPVSVEYPDHLTKEEAITEVHNYLIAICDDCNYDRHLCQVCGVGIDHGTTHCEEHTI